MSFSRKIRAVAVTTSVVAGFVALTGVAGAKASSDDGGGGDGYGGAPITPAHDVFPAGVPVAGTITGVAKAGSALPDGSSSGDSGNSQAGGG